MSCPRFCYIVLAHTGTDAVARLVRRIHALSPGADVVVRFGTEADLDARALAGAGAHVLASRIRTEWGAWSQVEAELEAYRTVRQRIDPDYVVVVSGQDYPVRDLARWERHVADSGIDALLEPMPLHEHSYGFRWLILHGPHLAPPARRAAEALAWRISRRDRSPVYVNRSGRPGDDRWWVGFRRRRPVAPPAKAASWKVLSRAAVDAVLAGSAHDPGRNRLIETFKCPDELFVPSVLRDTPRLRVEAGRTTFARFAPGAANPEWLTVALVDEAARSGAAFARKLRPRPHPAVLQRADAAAAS